MEFTYAAPVTRGAVVSYTAFSPLPDRMRGPAVIFCCTGPGVASAGRYPASCPVKPGLSSRAKRRRSLIPLMKYIFEGYLLGMRALNSHVEVTSSNEFPADRVVRNMSRIKPYKVLKELKEPLGLMIFGIFLCDTE